MHRRGQLLEDSESSIPAGEGADARGIPPYFRAAMSRPVMSAAEERAAVQEVRRLEREHWEVLLCVPGVVPEVSRWVAARVAEGEVAADDADVQHVEWLARTWHENLSQLASVLVRLDRDRACAAVARHFVEQHGTRLQHMYAQATYHSQEAAKHRFVLANLRFAGLLVRRHADVSGHLKLMDFFQEGVVGLMRALDLFEPERGVRFVTYATWWVYQRLTAVVDEAGHTVRVSRYTAELARVLHRAERGALAQGGAEYVEEVAAACLGLTAAQVRRVLLAEADVREPLDLDEHLGDGDEDDASVADTVADPDARSADVALDAARVVAALDDLPRREAVVMRLRYLEDLSYKECGDRLDLSAERVRQIEGMAMTKLRKRLHVKAG